MDHPAAAAETTAAPGGPDGADVPELRFVAPLLGLEQLRRFALVRLDEESPLFSLQSLEDAGTRLLVLAPHAVFPDYSPALDGVTRAALGLDGGAEPLLLVVVNAGPTLADSTANLMAPIAVNPETLAAAQVVLTGSDLPLRAALAA
jgi:flagellar assembly factor FliW